METRNCQNKISFLLSEAPDQNNKKETGKRKKRSESDEELSDDGETKKKFDGPTFKFPDPITASWDKNDWETIFKDEYPASKMTPFFPPSFTKNQIVRADRRAKELLFFAQDKKLCSRCDYDGSIEETKITEKVPDPFKTKGTNGTVWICPIHNTYEKSVAAKIKNWIFNHGVESAKYFELLCLPCYVLTTTTGNPYLKTILESQKSKISKVEESDSVNILQNMVQFLQEQNKQLTNALVSLSNNKKQ